jgi:hypothetical protein
VVDEGLGDVVDEDLQAAGLADGPFDRLDFSRRRSDPP